MASDAGTDYTRQDAGPDTESRDNLLIARVDCAHPEPLHHHPPPPPPLPAGIKDLSAKIVVAGLPRAFRKQKQDVHIRITHRLKATLLYKYLKWPGNTRRGRGRVGDCIGRRISAPPELEGRVGWTVTRKDLLQSRSTATVLVPAMR
ncbi:hypothetical protein F5J12DRAFT_915380 [Pisolithus orientalis]|uniref:uncharacterized protein n=1 Tax=Pisolithus orientalis TaxID=936130 RepID=UPI0022259D1E|nr:uncharacterized protein F5J12DRAFT_915380 [Pisolithus orientalis]KAI5993750.1 hypothetical protein F5J12DRAFT_915380 [Pisolithus orientalis]